MAPPSERGLLLEERRRRICELLREEGRVTVDSLASRFGISQVTIRADLALLESAGALTRTHGGAVTTPEADQSLNVKQLQHHAEKVRIAAAAAGTHRRRGDHHPRLREHHRGDCAVHPHPRPEVRQRHHQCAQHRGAAGRCSRGPAHRSGRNPEERVELALRTYGGSRPRGAAGRPALPRCRRRRSADRRHDSPPGRSRAQRHG